MGSKRSSSYFEILLIQNCNTKDLAWYNPKSKTWDLEEITYSVLLGSSSKTEDLLITEIKL